MASELALAALCFAVFSYAGIKIRLLRLPPNSYSSDCGKRGELSLNSGSESGLTSLGEGLRSAVVFELLCIAVDLS